MSATAAVLPDLEDMVDWSMEALEELAAPWPARWLLPPKPGDPERVVYLFAGPGGLEVGTRDVLGRPLDIIGVESSKDAAATAVKAGFQRIVADVRTLDPHHPALRWTRGLVVTAPCQCWTPAGKRAGQDPRNQQILLDMFACAWEATVGVWEEGRECAEDCPDGCEDCWDGWSGPIYGVDEVRAMAKDLTDDRIGLLAEVVIWGLALSVASYDFGWIAMEQSSALPQVIVDGIREELKCADWLSVEFQVLDAVDYGLASRRKRTFMLAARHRYSVASTRPESEIPTTTAARALGWPPGVRVNTRGTRKTAGGNCWSADRPATAITSKIRGWYWEHDKERRFSLDEAALLAGFRPGHPWTGSRSSCTQQIGDVVAPPMGAVVLGALLGVAWEARLREYLEEIYNRPTVRTEHALAA
ncbi:hypothetical protein AB0D63_21010 [Kitasatospora sp. NPDC048343]|uniref:hypothetical protein n=1 Tax=Kitasatospora sp. NPDC048343 TaxID=3154717 RepID=UPI0033C4A99A